MGPKSDQDHIQRFNQLSKNYVEDLNHTLRYTGGDGHYFYSMKLNLIQRNLNQIPGKILDFGCASGTFTEMLHKEFSQSQVFGYDPAEECIEEATRKAASSPNLKFTTNLNLLTTEPELVVASGVFHHIPPAERQNVCDSIFKLMPVGGRFFIFEHNPWNPATQLIVKNAPVDEGAILLRRGEGLKMLSDSGFKNLKSQFIGFVPPLLKVLLPLEDFLGWLPIGAQFMLIGDR